MGFLQTLVSFLIRAFLLYLCGDAIKRYTGQDFSLPDAFMVVFLVDLLVGGAVQGAILTSISQLSQAIKDEKEKKEESDEGSRTE